MADEDLDTSIKNIDTPDDSTSYTTTGLIPATYYTIYLSAFTRAGEGSISVNITNFTSFDGNYIANVRKRISNWGFLYFDKHA